MKKMGKLIALEGPDTSGKTTTINKLKAALPIIFENETFVFTREPGNLLRDGFNASEKIRVKLLTDETLTDYNQAKLFAIARKYHIDDVITKLKEGKNVIMDRFILSSLVYQGMKIGYDEVISLNRSALLKLKKENIEIHNIVLYLNKSIYNERISNKEKDAMELVDEETINSRLDFHSNVSFLKSLNVGQIYHVNANKKIDDTVIQTLNYIDKILKNN